MPSRNPNRRPIWSFDQPVQPRIYLADEHDIDSSQLDRDALYVIQCLQEAGYVAYLVGGGVRDLLVKVRPKDFDVSTSARPEEIKHLFRKNCLLIGRRFRLAHVRFGKKIIEVSTFRSGESADALIVRDNEWGSPEEDALRRDFTINGLFYDPTQHHVIDYVGGWEDLHARKLRTIGDPLVRFRQDPVRMIRLLKFHARFGFDISPETLQALQTCREEISKSAPARVMEEMFRMLESGAAEPFFRQLDQHRILGLLFPWLTQFLKQSGSEGLYKLLASADQVHRNSSRQSVLDRSILTSCLLYGILDNEVHLLNDSAAVPLTVGEISGMAAVLGRKVNHASFSHFPRRIHILSHFILTAQYRLTPVGHKIHYRSKLIRHPDFHLALQFLKLRAIANPDLLPIYEAWKEAREKAALENPDEPQEESLAARPPRRKRRGGRGRRPYVPRS